MDKIKQLFGWAKQKQFWLLSLFVAIASTAVFAITASGLGAALSSRITAINGKYSEVQGVSSKLATHPNDFSHAKMEAILKDLEKDVEIAWETQYKRQEGLMTWPSDTFRNEQKANIFRSLRPVEKFIEFPIENLASPLSLITDTDRGIYRDYVANSFPEIVKLIGTEWKATTRAIPVRQKSTGGYGEGSGMAGGGYPGTTSSSEDPSGGYGSGSYGSGSYGSGSFGMGAGMGGAGLFGNKDIVIWSQQSQQKLMNEILPWYDPKSLPSILEIYYTQEDIWLLNNIMEIIRRTNGNAREHFQAVIKEIEFIRMGNRANRDAGVLTKLQAMGGGGDMYGMGGVDGGDMSSAYGAESMGSGMGGSGMDGGMEDVDPADGRYISFAPENFFEPRVGSEIRESIKSIQAENAVDAVAKRVPIRIRVKMDPSKIHQFITQCGNAPFMLEVFQVRINTAPAAEASIGGGGYGGAYGASAGGYGASSGYGSSEGSYGGDPSSSYGESGGAGDYGSGGYGSGSMGMGGYGAGGYGAGGYGAGGMPGGMPGASRRPQQTIVGVEIYGLIYLYNPYDKQSLGGLEEEEVGEVEGTTEDKTPLEELNEKLESENALPPADAQPAPAVQTPATAPADNTVPSPLPVDPNLENGGAPATQPAPADPAGAAPPAAPVVPPVAAPGAELGAPVAAPVAAPPAG